MTFIKSLLITLSVVLVQLCGGTAFASEPLNLLSDASAPIGLHVDYLQEDAHPLTADDAHQAYVAGQFQPVGREQMSFGINPKPVWLAVAVENSGAQPLDRHFLIEVSWIDQIDLNFLRTGEVTRHVRIGDSLPFDSRPVPSRYFDVPHVFNAGTTVVLMRVQTVDPMDLPIYIITPEELESRSTIEAYSYGLLSGGLLALLAYNFLFFLGLRRARYAYYSLYLSCFIVMNVGYSGHGYRWLWPDSPVLQQLGILTFLLAY